MPEPQAQHLAHLDDRLLVCRHNGVAHDDVLIGARLASNVFALCINAGIAIDRLLEQLALSLTRNKACGYDEIVRRTYFVRKGFPGHNTFESLHDGIAALGLVHTSGYAPVCLLVDSSGFNHEASTTCCNHTSIGGMVTIVRAVFFAIRTKVKPPPATQPCGRSASGGNNMCLCAIIGEQQAVCEVSAYFSRHIGGVGEAAC